MNIHRRFLGILSMLLLPGFAGAIFFPRDDRSEAYWSLFARFRSSRICSTTTSVNPTIPATLEKCAVHDWRSTSSSEAARSIPVTCIRRIGICAASMAGVAFPTVTVTLVGRAICVRLSATLVPRTCAVITADVGTVSSASLAPVAVLSALVWRDGKARSATRAFQRPTLVVYTVPARSSLSVAACDPGWTEGECEIGTLEVYKLTACDSDWFDGFASTVAIDDNIVVVGAPSTGGFGTGSVYAFAISGSRWVEEAKLAPTNIYDSGKSISIDGNTLAVAGNSANYVYTRSDSVSWTEQAILKVSDDNSTSVEDSDGLTNDYSYSYERVFVSGDTIVVGLRVFSSEPELNNVYIFTRSGSEWTEKANLSVDDGRIYKMATDGSTVVVGTGYYAVNEFLLTTVFESLPVTE